LAAILAAVVARLGGGESDMMAMKKAAPVNRSALFLEMM
jgi:hypothetical protein